MKLENLTLPQLMLLWGSLDSEVNRIAELIQVQVLQLKQTQTIGDIRATYGHGQGSYNYQMIAGSSGSLLTEGAGEMVRIHTTETVNWKAVCADIETKLDIEAKVKFFALQKENFTPGKEQVRLSIIKVKESKPKEDK